MKALLNVDIEQLFNMMDESNWYTSKYCRTKAKPDKAFKNWEQRSRTIDVSWHDMQKADAAITGITWFLKMTKEEQERLRIAFRAYLSWEKRTDYQRCMTEDMQERFCNFIFGPENGVMIRRWFWDDGLYERKIVRGDY